MNLCIAPMSKCRSHVAQVVLSDRCSATIAALTASKPTDRYLCGQASGFGARSREKQDKQIALFRLVLAEIRPRIHYGAPPFEGIASPVCCFGLVLNRMGEDLFGKFVRKFGLFPNPVPGG